MFMVEQFVKNIRGFQRKVSQNSSLLSGLGATVLLFALGLLFTALWRRYFSESYYYLEDKGSDAGEEKTSNFSKIRNNKNSLSQGKISLPDWDLESGKQKVAIPADVFLNHVANLHCSGGEGE